MARYLAFVLATVLAALLATACGDDTGAPPVGVAPNDVIAFAASDVSEQSYSQRIDQLRRKEEVLETSLSRATRDGLQAGAAQ